EVVGRPRPGELVHNRVRVRPFECGKGLTEPVLLVGANQIGAVQDDLTVVRSQLCSGQGIQAAVEGRRREQLVARLHTLSGKPAYLLVELAVELSALHVVAPGRGRLRFDPAAGRETRPNRVTVEKRLHTELHSPAKPLERLREVLSVGQQLLNLLRAAVDRTEPEGENRCVSDCR